MEETHKDDQEVLETPEIESEELEDSTDKKVDEISAEEFEKIKKEKEELETKNKQLFERLKKKDKDDPKESGLSQKDVIYLAKADIHEDDIDEVVDLAKLKKISVNEAHKYMSPILKERQEQRTTASATHTKGGARGNAKVTPEQVLADAEKGKFPETEEEMQKAIDARFARKGQN